MKYPNLIFWGLILLGIILPFSIEFFVILFYVPRELISILGSIFTSFWEDPGISIFILFWNDISFIIIALVYYFQKLLNQNREKYEYHISGIIGALFVTFVTYFLIYLDYYVKVYSPMPRPSGFSTSAIAFLFIPVYVLALTVIGYVAGYGIARLIKSRSSKRSDVR
jgi:hypothetical protein